MAWPLLYPGQIPGLAADAFFDSGGNLHPAACLRMGAWSDHRLVRDAAAAAVIAVWHRPGDCGAFAGSTVGWHSAGSIAGLVAGSFADVDLLLPDFPALQRGGV